MLLLCNIVAKTSIESSPTGMSAISTAVKCVSYSRVFMKTINKAGAISGSISSSLKSRQNECVYNKNKTTKRKKRKGKAERKRSKVKKKKHSEE